MDPLTTLGLAANVIACVSFVSDLIKDATEIASSADGCSATTSRLESAYTDLKDLCTSLQSCIEQESTAGGDDEVKRNAVTIKHLSEICKQDCDELLKGLSELKFKNGEKGKRKGLKIALRSIRWSEKRIWKIEQRILSSQSTLTLAVSRLAYFSWVAHSKRLKELQYHSNQLQSNQATALESIKEQLDFLWSSFQFEKGQYVFTAKDGDDLQELQKRFKALSLPEQTIEQEQSILRSLTFDSRPCRHTQIEAAHTKTFRWALSRELNYTDGSIIGEWLATGTGIFWVSGKPGSGKSTLMKFMADSPTTKQRVQEWAQTSEVFIASHYFWISGTPMQKSHQGLLQTLLFDIFRQCPSLIREICSNRWEQSPAENPWSLTELRNALNRISSRKFVGQKFCFFIDGMDEFEGDHEAQTNLCRTFKELATSGNIKFVLSSRPWNIFEEQFGSACPKLYMQNLTHNDIQVYVQSSLEEHERWATITANDSQGDYVVKEITERSEGVFLWVRLVTKLLKRGLTNHDKLSDLHRRLQRFPTELESFFKAILESVEPFYHSHMATALQLAIHSGDQPLSFLAYHFHSQEYDDVDYANHLPVKLMDKRELEEIKNDTRWQLDSRTRGLLEINSQSGAVGFLHRTARDFLMTGEMHDFLTTKVDGRLQFNPNLSLLKVFVALIKVSARPTSIDRIGPGKYQASDSGDRLSQAILHRLLQKALTRARPIELDVSQDCRYQSLLDELDENLPCLLPKQASSFSPTYLSIVRQAVFREQLLYLGLFQYLRKKLDSEPTYLMDVGSLLYTPILKPSPYKSAHLHIDRGVEFLRYILEIQHLDASAKDRHSGMSHWLELLCNIGRSYTDWNDILQFLSFFLDKGILKLLLIAGGDPNAEILGSDPTPRGITARSVAALYVELCFQYTARLKSDQEVYLEVLEEFLRLSSRKTVEVARRDFSFLMTNKDPDSFRPLHLPFLTRVRDLLMISLNLCGSNVANTIVMPNTVAQEWCYRHPVLPPTIASLDSNLSPNKRNVGTDDEDCMNKKRRNSN